MRFRFRFLPLEAYGVIHFFIVLSLLYAPAPWLTGAGQYSWRSIAISATFGAVLAGVAIFAGIVRRIPFRVYLGITTGMAAILAIYAIVALSGEPTPRMMFLIYSGLILVTNAIVRFPPHGEAASITRVHPRSRGLTRTRNEPDLERRAGRRSS